MKMNFQRNGCTDKFKIKWGTCAAGHSLYKKVKLLAYEVLEFWKFIKQVYSFRNFQLRLVQYKRLHLTVEAFLVLVLNIKS